MQVTLDGHTSAEASGRERVLRAAYKLFTGGGTRTVGVDAVIAEAGVAKMTFYRHFPSKDDLILAVLRRREELWTYGWVQHGARERGDTPVRQLLAIFDLFEEWFQRDDFEGCLFVTTMLEVADHDDPVRQASVRHLQAIREVVLELARAAGAPDPEDFTCQWHLLMKGSIVARGEGDRQAAARARELARLLLARRGLIR